MEEKFDISKPGSSKLLDSTKYVFSEVDLKSPVWKYFLRDKKQGVAKCIKCDSILKNVQSTTTLKRHLKTFLHSEHESR